MTALIQWATLSRTVTIVAVGIVLVLVVGGLVLTWVRTLKRWRMGEENDGND